jgi:anti-sigma factor RsiW
MGEGLDISTLLRLGADGELTPEQAATLEAHLAANPADRERLAFERSLRSACARQMQGAAPAGLRDRIEAALREHAAEPEPVGAVHVAGRIPPNPVVRRRRGSLTNRVLNAAAVLVVAGLAVLFLRASLSQDATVAQAEAVAGFLPAEHSACTIDPDRLTDQDLAVTDLSNVPAAFRPLLGASPSIPDIEALGYRFTGAGPCAVPGGESVHLMFEAVSERRPPGCSLRPLSLFIQRTDRFNMQPGQTYVVESPDDRMTIYAWTSDGLVYYLVADSKGQCSEVMKAIPLRVPALKLREATRK